MYEIWKKLERMPYLLDDSVRDPFTFGQMLAASTTLPFALGREPHGIVWFQGVSVGGAAQGAVALWGYPAFNRPDLLNLCIQAAFRHADLHRLYALVAVPNEPSHRLMGSLNFQREGLIREALQYNGAWTDLVIYGLLRREISDAIQREAEEDPAKG